MTKQPTPIRCSACGTPYNAEVYTILEADQEPQAKARLLNGTLNNTQCPNCGTLNKVMTPLLYHDPAKELLIAMVPMEINMPKDQQEKIIGDMMNKLPKENFKAYMFNPRRALTMQGLIDQVLEADGVNPEDWKKQQESEREYIDLLQKFIEVESEEALNALIQEHDTDINEDFFKATNRMIQTSMESGRPDVAQQVMAVQSMLTSLSTYGKEMIEKQQAIIQEVTDAIQSLGNDATRESFFDLALQYAGDQDHLRTLVRMARPVFDYQFFQELTARIGQLPAQAREKVEHLRDRIEELTTALDQQEQANAVALLQAIVNHPNPQEVLSANISAIDETFMNILRANIQNAEATKNIQASTRLKQIEQMIQQIMQQMQGTTNFLRELLSTEDQDAFLRENIDKIDDNLLTILMMNIEAAEQNGDSGPAQRLHQLYEKIVTVLQDNMQPELRFVNELLSAEDDDSARALLNEHASEYDNELLEVMDAVEQMLASQGAEELLERLKLLRADAGEVIKT